MTISNSLLRVGQLGEAAAQLERIGDITRDRLAGDPSLKGRADLAHLVYKC